MFMSQEMKQFGHTQTPNSQFILLQVVNRFAMQKQCFLLYFNAQLNRHGH